MTRQHFCNIVLKNGPILVQYIPCLCKEEVRMEGKEKSRCEFLTLKGWTLLPHVLTVFELPGWGGGGELGGVDWNLPTVFQPHTFPAHCQIMYRGSARHIHTIYITILVEKFNPPANFSQFKHSGLSWTPDHRYYDPSIYRLGPFHLLRSYRL